MEGLKLTRIHYIHTRIRPAKNVSSENLDANKADEGFRFRSDIEGYQGHVSSMLSIVFDDINITDRGSYCYSHHDFEVDRPILQLGTTGSTIFQGMARVVSAKLFDTAWLSKKQKRMHMDPSGELHGLEVALYYAGEKQPKVCHFCWDMGKDLSALPDQFLCLLNGMHVPLSAIKSEGVKPAPQDSSNAGTALQAR